MKNLTFGKIQRKQLLTSKYHANIAAPPTVSVRKYKLRANLDTRRNFRNGFQIGSEEGAKLSFRFDKKNYLQIKRQCK